METGLTTDPLWARAGDFHRVTDPAQMGRATICRLTPRSPCLRTGLNLTKQFRVDPGPLDFFGNAVHPSAPANFGAAGPKSGVE